MKTHQLIQGSPEWLAYRAQHFNASDAPAMMGCSPYKSRSQLLHELHTGLVPEVDAATQRRFDDGHRFEALARPLAEEIIGQELYPVTGSEGRLSASFDGLTMCETTGFEHKSLNDTLRACMRDEGNGYSLPLHYQVQMEQQLMVSGAERVLFMASTWDGDELAEKRHCWYASDPKLRAAIIAGWSQFATDLAAYVPPAAPAAPVVGRAPEHLPALRIEVSGAVTASNLAEFKATALAAIAGVNRELSSDADFADAEASVKWCSEVESRLAAAKQHALSQTVDIDALFRTMDDIAAEARRVRLELDKLVKQRKEQLRGEIVAEGVAALRKHIDGLNTRIGQPWMPAIPADFGGAVKGKRSIDSLRDAVGTTLANAKIAANEVADRISVNLAALNDAGNKFLFRDAQQLVLQNPDACAAIVQNRLAEHAQKEEARIEAETARIRAEVEQQERAKAERAAREQAEADAKVRREAEAAERARLAEAASAELKAAQQSPVGAELSPAAQALNEQQGAQRFAQAHPAAKVAKVVSMPVKPAAPSVREQLNARLDLLAEAELQRVLSFIQSRYGMQATA